MQFHPMASFLSETRLERSPASWIRQSMLPCDRWRESSSVNSHADRAQCAQGSQCALSTYCAVPELKKGAPLRAPFFICCLQQDYLRILVTTPAPTVLPPSRIAKRRPSSIAIGVISSIVI